MGRLASLLTAASVSSAPLKTFLAALAGAVDKIADSASVQTLVWVATNGNDSTGQRGNINRPFLTLAAAIAAAQDGDTILVAPGTYTTTVTPSTGAKNLTIEGLGGPENCILRSTTGAALTCPGGNAQYLVLANIALVTTFASPAFTMGPGGGVITSSALRARNTEFTAPGGNMSATLQGLGAVDFTACRGKIRFEDVVTGQIIDHTGGNVEVNRAVDNAGIIYFRDCTLNTVTLEVAPRVHFDRATVIDALASDGDLGVGAEINFAGTAGSVSVDFGGAAALPDMVFDNCKVLGGTAFGTQTATVGGQPVSAKGAKFNGGIQANAAGAEPLVIDNRSGYCNMAASTWVNTAFDRDQTTVRGVILAPGLSTLTFGVGDLAAFPRFPSAASVSWQAHPINALAAIADLPFATNSSGSETDFTTTAGCTADVSIVRAEGGGAP